MLKDKNILLGVCGSIAAFKAAILIRLLIKSGANVQVIMTPDARNFITPLTLSTLSKKPVLTDYFNAKNGEWNNHVELALWADLILIAPASANTLSKCANGLCDNLLTAVYLSAKCPVYFAPAMDLDMWKHSATRLNIHKLESFGNIQIQPAFGELASGLTGEGRMTEPQEIIKILEDSFKKKLLLKNKKALVTAGPTYESIDPVRFIGNHSSGKMGFAIAEELFNMGANVTLVSGPTSLETPTDGIDFIQVTSSDEMYAQVHTHFQNCDIMVMNAAVADYKPEFIETQKIKKNDEGLSIQLVKTKDILSSLGEIKTGAQILVGFALETNDEEANAIRKLEKKNLDLIVLNSLKEKGAGFKGDTNKITIIDRSLAKKSYPLKSKKQVASDICARIAELVK